MGMSVILAALGSSAHTRNLRGGHCHGCQRPLTPPLLPKMLPDLRRLSDEFDLNSVGKLTAPVDLVAIGIFDGRDIVPIRFWNFENRADPVRWPAKGGIFRRATGEFPEFLDVLVVWSRELTAVEAFKVQTHWVR